MKTTIEYATLLEKLEALKAHLLETNAAEAEDLEGLIPDNCYRDSWGTFEVIGNEYKVLTEEEADEAAREEIKESIWAFRAEYILHHTTFYETSSQREDEIFCKSLEEMQSRLCESAAPVIMALIKDFDSFASEAIRDDGRGQFIAHYDGEEHESADGKYLIYWVN